MARRFVRAADLLSPSSDQKDRSFIMMVLYSGPFGRLANWFFRTEPPDESWRCRLGVLCDGLEGVWLQWYVRHRRTPSARWKREPG